MTQQEQPHNRGSSTVCAAARHGQKHSSNSNSATQQLSSSAAQQLNSTAAQQLGSRSRTAVAAAQQEQPRNWAMTQEEQSHNMGRSTAVTATQQLSNSAAQQLSSSAAQPSSSAAQQLSGPAAVQLSGTVTAALTNHRSSAWTVMDVQQP